MMKMAYSMIMLLLVVSAGCATTQAINRTNSTDLGVGTASCTPVTYKKISASAKDRPSWIWVPPGDEGGMHFLIGMSGYYATERDARDDSMRYAREEFAKYTGVEVHQLDEISKAIYGASSGVLDPTVSGKTQTTQEANALVSRVKARTFYSETLKAQCGDKDMGIAYQYWVIAEVPVEEYDKVQAWKAKQEAAKEAEKMGGITRVREEIERLAVSHKAAIAEAETLLAKADPIGALSVLQGDWSRLYDNSKSIEERGGPEASEAGHLKVLQQEVPPAVQRIRSALMIDPGRGATAWAPAGGDQVIEIPVWVWSRRGDQMVPVPNIPLIIKESGAKTSLSAKKTDSRGQALFQIKRIRPGNYEVSIDPQESAVASLDPVIQKIMTSVNTTLTVREYTPDMAGAAKTGVQQLFKGSSIKPLPVTKVVMGSVRYEDTRLGSEFGKRLETLIERELSQIPDIQVIRRQETRGIDQLEAVSKTRGIEMTDHPIPSMNSPAIQAQLDGAEGALEVSYGAESRWVTVDLRLIQAGTGVTLASAGSSMEKRLVSSNLQLTPPSSGDDVVALPGDHAGSIHLELTTQRGDGATFAQGEKIIYYVSSDRDAYMLLLYKDAEGHLIQIYPNARSGKGFHKAGEYMSIPDKADPFDFTIAAPFGAEQVWVFASGTSFPILKGNGLSNGLTVLKEDLNDVVAQLRAHGQKTDVSYGEANVVVTTVKE